LTALLHLLVVFLLLHLPGLCVALRILFQPTDFLLFGLALGLVRLLQLFKLPTPFRKRFPPLYYQCHKGIGFALDCLDERRKL